MNFLRTEGPCIFNEQNEYALSKIVHEQNDMHFLKTKEPCIFLRIKGDALF